MNMEDMEGMEGMDQEGGSASGDSIQMEGGDADMMMIMEGGDDKEGK